MLLREWPSQRPARPVATSHLLGELPLTPSSLVERAVAPGESVLVEEAASYDWSAKALKAATAAGTEPRLSRGRGPRTFRLRDRGRKSSTLGSCGRGGETGPGQQHKQTADKEARHRDGLLAYKPRPTSVQAMCEPLGSRARRVPRRRGPEPRATATVVGAGLHQATPPARRLTQEHHEAGVGSAAAARMGRGGNR